MHLRKKIFYYALVGALSIFAITTTYASTTIGNNVSVGGTLAVTGHTTPVTDNLYDFGASSTQWRYGNFQQGLLVADGTNTSTLANTSLIIAQATSFNLGKFYVDSSGNITASGTLAVVGNTTLTGNLTVDTNTFFVNASTNKVGVVSTTPMAQLSIGAGAGASSTIATGKFCMYAGQENGTMVYVKLDANAVSGHPFSTTTVSCF